MKAIINQGTAKEISWEIDEAITPDLVKSIEQAGKDKRIDWKDSPLYYLVKILLESISFDELEERMYDEDPEIVDLIRSELDTYSINSDEKNAEILARLYLPVMIVILYLFR